MDTRLPASTVIESDDWHEVLSTVFDPLDARTDRPVWGFTEEEYAAMTRGQQAVFKLRWLRDFMEADTFLEYGEEPVLSGHADRLVEDAELVGALPFVPILVEIAPLVAEAHEPPLSDALLDEVQRLEEAFFAIEEEHGALGTPRRLTGGRSSCSRHLRLGCRDRQSASARRREGGQLHERRW